MKPPEDRMTVKDLITKLLEYPLDIPVVTRDARGWPSKGVRIHSSHGMLGDLVVVYIDGKLEE